MSPRPNTMLTGRYVVGGSGSDLFSEPRCCDEILRMIGDKKDIQILYFGVAAYDAPASYRRQTEHFRKAGATISEIRCTRGGIADIEWISPPAEEGDADVVVRGGKKGEDGSATVPDDAALAKIRSFVEDRADAILVSGGNTLYAVDRLLGLGIDQWMKKAAARGAVMCGGSAGAVVFFENGHSDSADPDSWYAKYSMLEKMKKAVLEKTGEECDESTVREKYRALMEKDQLSALTMTEGGGKGGDADGGRPTIDAVFDDPAAAAAISKWQYIRIPGIAFLPGLCVPHQDKVQSNGTLRADHVNEMLTQLACCGGRERAVCIDHWAVLSIENGHYKVLSFEDKPGSGLPVKAREFKPLEEEILTTDANSGLPMKTILRLVDGVEYDDAGNRLSLDMQNLRISAEEGPDRETTFESMQYVKDRSGRPVVWIKEVLTSGEIAADGGLKDITLSMRCAPFSGSVEDLFAPNRAYGDCPVTANNLKQCRENNPAF